VVTAKVVVPPAAAAKPSVKMVAAETVDAKLRAERNNMEESFFKNGGLQCPGNTSWNVF
jgi:hypothetical protein